MTEYKIPTLICIAEGITLVQGFRQIEISDLCVECQHSGKVSEGNRNLRTDKAYLPEDFFCIAVNGQVVIVTYGR